MKNYKSSIILGEVECQRPNTKKYQQNKHFFYTSHRNDNEQHLQQLRVSQIKKSKIGLCVSVCPVKLHIQSE